MLYYVKPSLGMLKKEVKSKSVNRPGQLGASPMSTKGYMAAGSSGIDDVEGWSPGIYTPIVSTTGNETHLELSRPSCTQQQPRLY